METGSDWRTIICDVLIIVTVVLIFDLIIYSWHVMK